MFWIHCWNLKFLDHRDVRYTMHREFKGKGNNWHFPYFSLGEHGTLVTIESQIFIKKQKKTIRGTKKIGRILLFLAIVNYVYKKAIAESSLLRDQNLCRNQTMESTIWMIDNVIGFVRIKTKGQMQYINLEIRSSLHDWSLWRFD